ncbi:hypothetical protein [Candidatus Steffania adelgidicola]|uniref:hypothetical protein n=1 Tax=Candidatus Steffania adelgidicola TaxID=1076626 RepID=UPI001D026072|nr:hypothetical protein [Candidatus Steffania adelgidicola]UDG79999.1 hypothetical protein GFK82_00551 [Candidatus Steffania adelgidicola]
MAPDEYSRPQRTAPEKAKNNAFEGWLVAPILASAQRFSDYRAAMWVIRRLNCLYVIRFRVNHGKIED